MPKNLKAAIPPPTSGNSFPVLSAHRSGLLAGFLFVMLAWQCFYSAWTQGQTTDEAFFAPSGYSIVRYNNYEFLGEHPPLILQLGALPLLAIQPKFPIKDPLYVPGTDRLDLTQNGLRFLYKMGNDPDLILFLQRIPIVLLTVLLGVGVFLFTRELWGDWGGLLSLALFSFSPNMIAHGSLYTTDLGLTAFYFFVIYAFKRFSDSPSDRRVAWLGLACGAALMTKISSLILLPVLSSLFLVYYFTEARQTLIEAPSLSFEKWILGIALFLIANAIGERQAMVLFGPFLVFAAYLCARDIEKLRNSRALRIALKGAALAGAILCVVYSIRLKKKYGISAASILAAGNLVALGAAVLLARLSTEDVRIRVLKYFLAIWVLAALVIVLGYTDFLYKFYRFIGFGNYMKPLGIVLSHSKGGHGACVEGSFITCDWRYFPGVMAIKTPLLTLVLTVIGAMGLLFSKRSILTKSLVFVPLVFFLAAAMLNKIHIGLRHILPVFPFFFLLAGYAGYLIGKIKPKFFRNAVAVFLTLLVILSAGRSLAGGPDHLAYFNELTGGPEQGAKLVADSNLNWGQDNKRLAEFVLEKKIRFIKIMAEAMNTDVYSYYKIPWKMLEPGDLIDPAPGFYALGIGCYTQQQNDPRSWFKGKQPKYRAGKTFYAFEVPNKPTLDNRLQATD
ncbi:MAG: glycosyltransferase family 39 protein [Candidatus Omnitrophota bacterium]